MRNIPTVAIVDDDESVRDTTKDLLDSAGLSAATFDSAESFLQSKDTRAIQCLVADMRMPGMTGLELHGRLAAAGTPIPTILVTAYPDERVRSHALEKGVICLLAKPFNAEDLLAYIETACADAVMRPAPGSSAALSAFELRFPSLSGTGRTLSFPCDASGSVQMDSLSERARNNYLLARALTGRDYGWPSVQPSCQVQT